MKEINSSNFNKNIFETTRREIYWRLKEFGLEEQEAQAESGLIIEHISGTKHAQQLISDLTEFPSKWLDEISRILHLRRERRPLAYCLGEIEFAGLAYRIIPGVLIPRTDTETLVEAVVEWAKKNEAEAGLNIAEIGVGSGIIAVSLLMRIPNCTVWACDISEAPIAIATGNARRHGVHERLTLVHGDWKKVMPNNFDLIVSNPPYIPSSLDKRSKARQEKHVSAEQNQASLKKELEPEIYFEPKEALFAGEDGLDFYRHFAQLLPKHFGQRSGLSTHSDFLAAFEIGDEQEEPVREIFKNHGWQNIEIKKDINNLPRVLSAKPSGPSF